MNIGMRYVSRVRGALSRDHALWQDVAGAYLDGLRDGRQPEMWTGTQPTLQDLVGQAAAAMGIAWSDFTGPGRGRLVIAARCLVTVMLRDCIRPTLSWDAIDALVHGRPERSNQHTVARDRYYRTYKSPGARERAFELLRTPVVLGCLPPAYRVAEP